MEERAQGPPVGTGPEPGDRHVGQGGKRLFSSFSGEEIADGERSWNPGLTSPRAQPAHLRVTLQKMLWLQTDLIGPQSSAAASPP